MAIGYDVEFFLRNETGYIPAERVMSGSKSHASTIGPGLVGHPDNIMAEIASASPFNATDLADRIKGDMYTFANHVSPLEIVRASSISVSRSWLDSCENANEIGCDVDYQDGVPRNPITAKSIGLERYAGGHLHFDVQRCIDPAYAASVCDIMLAVPCIANGERQGGRRSVYGLPGLYRPKPYGMEYRTMSNFWVRWLEGSDEFARLVALTAKAFETIVDPVLKLPAIYGQMARDVIMNEDQDSARNLYDTIRVHIGDML